MSTVELTRRLEVRVDHAFPVVEVFGPTVQGEGPDAGRRSFFVRFGGCDFRCSWCDSMHAVEPALVRQAPRRTTHDVLNELDRLGALHGDLIVLSGGNPALHHAGNMVAVMHRRGLRVSVETQGSVWRDWLSIVDRLVVSPKAPSSGMATPEHAEQFARFWSRAGYAGGLVALKVVVFDRTDYEWARELIRGLSWRPEWIGLSAGTDSRGGEELLATARRYRWLAEQVAGDVDPVLAGVVVLPQLHVIAWGHALGR